MSEERPVAKPVNESRVEMSYRMLPHDANPAGNVHGGVVMKLLDSTAAVVAMRHARQNVVTVSVDRLTFLKPVFVGELLTMSASLNMVGRTSMEVGVRVTAENLVTGVVRHTNSAYLSFVAMGPDGKPTEVPELILETDEDRRRNREARLRRELRLKEREMEEASQRQARAGVTQSSL
ncbi:MAG: acyl-CoA thioesterase [Deltaproteobacteria bacterium]|nr:acyl-CoA thioesterase [Deltaproteobacteria bacterium]